MITQFVEVMLKKLQFKFDVVELLTEQSGQTAADKWVKVLKGELWYL